MGNHCVPQWYLRGFATVSDADCVWQFDKQQGEFSSEPLPIVQVAQSRQFYDATTEADLNRLVEVPGNGVLDKLRAGNLLLSDQEKADLSTYIATMIKRVPKHREKAAAIVPQALAAVTEELREQIRAYAEAGQLSPEVAQQRIAETDAVEKKFTSQMPGDVQAKLKSPWPTPDMVKLIYGMDWRFVRAPVGHSYITTDNPAFFFESYGLGTETSEMTFPVSSELAIFGSWTRLKGDRQSVRTQFLKEANRRLISGASRFVYCQSKLDWIATVAAKPSAYLSRIIW